jgi:hypothetical protein
VPIRSTETDGSNFVSLERICRLFAEYECFVLVPEMLTKYVKLGGFGIVPARDVTRSSDIQTIEILPPIPTPPPSPHFFMDCYLIKKKNILLYLTVFVFMPYSRTSFPRFWFIVV